jgi:hypothetical protein
MEFILTLSAPRAGLCSAEALPPSAHGSAASALPTPHTPGSL